MKRRLLILACGLVTLASTAWGQGAIVDSNRWRHWDFSLQTRYIASKEWNGEKGSSLKLDDDLGWGFGFGYNANEHVNVGFLMSWRAVPYEAKVVNANDPTDYLRYSNWLDTGTLALTGEYNVLTKSLTPYVNGAVGWTMLDTNIAAGTDGFCWWDPWYGYICDSYVYTYGSDEASFSLGAGLRWELAGKAYVRAGYEYNWITVNETPGFNVVRFDVGLIY